MNNSEIPSGTEASLYAVKPRKVSFWKKLGAGSLTISILFHGVLLVVGLLWIFQVVREPEKKVDFMPAGGGGGQRGAEKMAVKKLQQITPPTNVKRVFAEGAQSSYAIPEQGDKFGEMSTLDSLSGGSMGGGLGGAGSGGGLGTGQGKGLGAGLGAGAGSGGGMGTVFGLADLNVQALTGTFYDMKQTDKREPTDVEASGMKPIINEFVNGGWRDNDLKKYFRAPQKLRQTKIFIPQMSASGAPSAFGCEKEVQPSRWIVVYRGSVIAPKSGRFRFVGAADDILVVRFNRKVVLDHGFGSGTTGMYL
ncbi:MAG TPA: hypothetical protein VF258_01195, partial [Luteolibacter sp.]